MTGFDESRHARDRAGKFAPHVSAAQEGTLDGDSGLRGTLEGPIPEGVVSRDDAYHCLTSAGADPVDAEDAIYDARLRQVGWAETSRGGMFVCRDGSNRDPDTTVYRLELDGSTDDPDTAG